MSVNRKLQLRVVSDVDSAVNTLAAFPITTADNEGVHVMVAEQYGSEFFSHLEIDEAIHDERSFDNAQDAVLDALDRAGWSKLS